MAPMFDMQSPTAQMFSPGKKSGFAFNMHQRSSSMGSGFFRPGPHSPVTHRHQREPSADESWDMGDDIGSEAERHSDESTAPILRDDNYITFDFYKPEVDQFALELDEVTRTGGSKEEMGITLLERFIDFSESKLMGFEQEQEDPEVPEDSESLEALHIEQNYWKMEQQTWELLAVLMDHKIKAQEAQLKDFTPSQEKHKADFAIREHMMQTHPKFDELNVILEWLQRHAPAPIEELHETIQGGGGWVYTKEKIKADKRVNPANQLTFKGNKFSLKLQARKVVTELDPDATTRQQRVLEPEDSDKERYLMKAVWSCLRNGDINLAQRVCEDNGEFWRAASLSGHQDAWDPNVDGPTSDDVEVEQPDGYFEVVGNRRRELWKRMCYALAKRTDCEMYERAVYGTLCGDVDSVIPACESWEDHLFAHINSLVEGAFSNVLASTGRISSAVQSFPMIDTTVYHSLTTTLWEDDTIMPRIIDSIAAIAELSEARLPLRIIQGSLISRRFKGLADELNQQLVHYQNNTDFSPVDDENGLDVCDCRLLRFVVHVILIMQTIEIGFTEGTPEHTSAENIIGAYIQFLVEAGQYELLPLYAARLSPGKAIEILGVALLYLKGDDRREELLRLMQIHNIDISGCLCYVVETALSRTEEIYTANRLASGEGVVNKRFSAPLADEDDLLVSSLEWLVLGGPSMRPELVQMGMECYKRFLLSGRLLAARQLFDRVSSKNIIPNQDTNGYMANEDEMIDDELGALDEETKNTAVVYIQCEALIGAIISLDEWRSCLERKPERLDRKYKDELRAHFGLVRARLQEVTETLFEGTDFLEVPEIVEIRNIYIPELVLALHQCFGEASKFLSKQWLVSILDLAVIVADPERNILQSFQATGRIEEYVNEVAEASRDMLGVAQEGNRGSSTAAAAVAIWNV